MASVEIISSFSSRVVGPSIKFSSIVFFTIGGHLLSTATCASCSASTDIYILDPLVSREMVLTEKQRKDLNAGILGYLKESGEAFAGVVDVFAEAAGIDVNTDKPARTAILEKKWTSVVRLPLYTKNRKSKSWFAAGWYSVKRGRKWRVVQDPKLIALQRYPYQGPFHNKDEVTV